MKITKTPAERHTSGYDANPHPAIQPWSKGELFPAVIATVEVYDDLGEILNASLPLAARLRYTAHDLIFPGEKTERYSHCEDAEIAARYLLNRTKTAVIPPAEMAVWDAAYADAYGVT